jgi:hypothetical protein
MMGDVRHMASNIVEQYLLQGKLPEELQYYFPEGKFSGQVIIEKTCIHGVECNKVIWITCIRSLDEGQGNTTRAIRELLKHRYDVRIVLPNDTMKHIAKKFGMVEKFGQSCAPYYDERQYYALPEECDAGYISPCGSDCAWCQKNRECKYKLFLDDYAYII